MSVFGTTRFPLEVDQNLHKYELLEAKEQVFGKYNLLDNHDIKFPSF
jgi:hypothetical protein